MNADSAVLALIVDLQAKIMALSRENQRLRQELEDNDTGKSEG